MFKNVVHSLEPGETLIRLQTMCNVLKYCKILQNGSVQLRCGCVYFFNLLKTSTVHKYPEWNGLNWLRLLVWYLQSKQFGLTSSLPYQCRHADQTSICTAFTHCQVCASAIFSLLPRFLNICLILLAECQTEHLCVSFGFTCFCMGFLIPQPNLIMTVMVWPSFESSLKDEK